MPAVTRRTSLGGRFARGAALAALVSVGACGDRPGTRDASEQAARFAHRFDEIERWLLRALASETVPSERVTFEARLFANVAHDDAVVEAWIARTGTAPLLLSAHGTPSVLDDDRLTLVRTADGRELRVGFASIDDPTTRVRDPVAAVLLERRTRPSGTEEVSVAVAFRR